MECQICKKVFNNFNGLSKHIHNQHKEEFNIKLYYNNFLKKSEDDGCCKTCKKETTFRNINSGYLRYCSNQCRSNDPNVLKKISEKSKGRKQSKETIEKRILNTNQKTKEENRIKTLKEKYGENIVNPSQIPSYREKYKETSLKNWGTEYPTQNPKVFNRVKYKKRNIIINGYSFSDIQGYEDLFLEQLNELFPKINYEDLLEERCKTLYMTNNHIHFPDFYSKKHNHMFEVKSEWTYEKNKENVLLKKSEAEKQGFNYTIIIWKRRNSKPKIIN